MSLYELETVDPGSGFRSSEFVPLRGQVAVDAGIFSFAHRGRYVAAVVTEKRPDGGVRVEAGSWWAWTSSRVLRRVAR